MTGTYMYIHTTQDNGTNINRPLTDFFSGQKPRCGYHCSHRLELAAALLQYIGPKLFNKLYKQIRNKQN